MDFRKEPLLDPASIGIVIGWIVLHVASLAAAWATRIAVDSRLELPLQFACYGAIGAVGTSAWISQQYADGLSIVSGLVLVVTVLLAVVDFRRTHEVQPILHSVSQR
jgi:hypothetical protein